MSFGAGKGPQRKTKSEVLKDKSAGELNAILSSNNSALSIQTPGLLMNMDDNSVLPKEQADLRDKLRIKGPNAVIKMKDEIAISNLKERLKNEDPLVKSRAGDLKKLSDDSGSPVLKETLNDLNPKVKDYSAALLGNEAGLHAALKVLRERLNDSSYNVQVASAEALWRIVKNAEY